MDFDFTEEQRLLKESLDRLIADRYGFDQRKGYAQNPEGWSRALWLQLAELGLLGLPFAERFGGSDGGPVETMIVMERLGQALAVEPYLATVVLGSGFLSHGGNEAQQARGRAAADRAGRRRGDRSIVRRGGGGDQRLARADP